MNNFVHLFVCSIFFIRLSFSAGIRDNLLDGFNWFNTQMTRAGLSIVNLPLNLKPHVQGIQFKAKRKRSDKKALKTVISKTELLSLTSEPVFLPHDIDKIIHVRSCSRVEGLSGGSSRVKADIGDRFLVYTPFAKYVFEMFRDPWLGSPIILETKRKMLLQDSALGIGNTSPRIQNLISHQIFNEIPSFIRPYIIENRVITNPQDVYYPNAQGDYDLAYRTMNIESDLVFNRTRIPSMAWPFFKRFGGKGAIRVKLRYIITPNLRTLAEISRVRCPKVDLDHKPRTQNGRRLAVYLKAKKTDQRMVLKDSLIIDNNGTDSESCCCYNVLYDGDLFEAKEAHATVKDFKLKQPKPTLDQLIAFRSSRIIASQ